MVANGTTDLTIGTLTHSFERYSTGLDFSRQLLPSTFYFTTRLPGRSYRINTLCVSIFFKKMIACFSTHWQYNHSYLSFYDGCLDLDNHFPNCYVGFIRLVLLQPEAQVVQIRNPGFFIKICFFRTSIYSTLDLTFCPLLQLSVVDNFLEIRNWKISVYLALLMWFHMSGIISYAYKYFTVINEFRY